MPRPSEYSRIFKTAAEVWSYLKREGGLQPERYDRGVVAELRRRLGLPGQRGMAHEIKRAGVTVETFITEFLRQAEPFALMMSELLSLFERAGATRSNQNLRVLFDFGKSWDQDGLRLQNQDARGHHLEP